MHIRLMANIKQQAVLRGVKHAFEHDRQLHDAKIGRQMAAVMRDIQHEKLADFLAELLKLPLVQREKILSGADLTQ